MSSLVFGSQSHVRPSRKERRSPPQLEEVTRGRSLLTSPVDFRSAPSKFHWRPAFGAGGRSKFHWRPAFGAGGRSKFHWRPAFGAGGRSKFHWRPAFGAGGRSKFHWRPA